MTKGFQKKGGHKHGKAVANQESALDADRFVRFLWGNIFYNPDTRKFSKSAKNGDEELERSFQHFVLNPLYKLITKSLQGESSEIERVLKDEFCVDMEVKAET